MSHFALLRRRPVVTRSAANNADQAGAEPASPYRWSLVRSAARTDSIQLSASTGEGGGGGARSDRVD
jgi:hypothetical protein